MNDFVVQVRLRRWERLLPPRIQNGYLQISDVDLSKNTQVCFWDPPLVGALGEICKCPGALEPLKENKKVKNS